MTVEWHAQTVRRVNAWHPIIMPPKAQPALSNGWNSRECARLLVIFLLTFSSARQGLIIVQFIYKSRKKESKMASQGLEEMQRLLLLKERRNRHEVAQENLELGSACFEVFRPRVAKHFLSREGQVR